MDLIRPARINSSRGHSSERPGTLKRFANTGITSPGLSLIAENSFSLNSAISSEVRCVEARALGALRVDETPKESADAFAVDEVWRLVANRTAWMAISVSWLNFSGLFM